MKDRLQHFQARRLESLRFWLIHAIGSIHAYLCGQVLQSLSFMLEKALSEADDLDTMIRGELWINVYARVGPITGDFYFIDASAFLFVYFYFHLVSK